MTFCPFGIDTQMIMSVAKAETMDSTKADFEQAVRNLTPEVQERWPEDTGRDAVSVAAEGADVLYVALAGKHSIIPAAAIMNAAGEKWTLSRFDAVRLKVKEVAIIECGTAFRVMKYMTGAYPFKVVAFVELIARYLRQGRITLDRSKLEGKLTYHDPCQIARNGGVIEEPRYVIRHLTDDFVELRPNRENTWCCGGGGGLVAMGEKDFRMESARVKADQVKASGAAIICTACENCHSQLLDLNEHYGLGMRVEFLSKLVANALVSTRTT
jgi:hypothetical protein